MCFIDLAQGLDAICEVNMNKAKYASVVIFGRSKRTTLLFCLGEHNVYIEEDSTNLC